MTAQPIHGQGPDGIGFWRPVKKVVFMGMGEPAHNLDNVLEAIELLGTLGGIGHKELVLSTVGDDEVQGLVRLLRGRHLMLNLIPFNRVEGSGYDRPAWEHAAEMTRQLNRAGVLTRLRRSAAQEVDGGYGQLRARSGGAAVRAVVPIALAAG